MQLLGICHWHQIIDCFGCFKKILVKSVLIFINLLPKGSIAFYQYMRKEYKIIVVKYIIKQYFKQDFPSHEDNFRVTN